MPDNEDWNLSQFVSIVQYLSQLENPEKTIV